MVSGRTHSQISPQRFYLFIYFKSLLKSLIIEPEFLEAARKDFESTGHNLLDVLENVFIYQEQPILGEIKHQEDGCKYQTLILFLKGSGDDASHDFAR